MGADGSKNSPFLKTPWRTITWGELQPDLQQVKNYKPQTEGQQLRILIYGPVGAGKSSFINSVQTVLHERIYRQALACNNFGACFTKKYSTYKIQKQGQETFYPFVFNDVMGLSKEGGIPLEDIQMALKGHMKDGYEFNPASKLSEGHASYIKTPNPNNKVHVLVCVMDANTLAVLQEQKSDAGKQNTGSKELFEKIQLIRKEASRLGIPQLAILTKIDLVCPEIKSDLRNVYKIKKVKDKMEKLSVEVGIPMDCIFPVKNYHEEINVDSDINSLIMNAMSHIISSGDDFLRRGQSAGPRNQPV